MTTPIDIIRLALQNSGTLTLAQTIYADDLENALAILNSILAQWQVNRWLVYDLVTANHAQGTLVNSFTVGATGDFVFPTRPDKVDAVYATIVNQDASTSDVYLYPFMSREGYDRIVNKTATGIPESFYYDPTLAALGNLYVYPIPAVGSTIHVQAKASLGQFANLTDVITLPQIYLTAMIWVLGAHLLSVYGLPMNPMVSRNAEASLNAISQSIAQVPTLTSPIAGNRAGVFSNAGTIPDDSH